MAGSLEKLEKRIAKLHTNRYGIAVNSGYSALILAVRVLVEEGDEVICPDYTMGATAFAITLNRARPKFVDCRDDLTIDPDKIRLAITEKTKAIMITHIYGRVCEMDKILQIARQHNLRVIEDCAEAHGAKGICKGDVSCFSFYKNKIVAGEEGGMCLTNDKDLAKRMRSLKCMAFAEEGNKFNHTELGYNFRMPQSQAEMIYKHSLKIKRNLQKRREIEQIYNAFLPKRLQMPPREVVWVYDICTGYPQELLQYLQENNVNAREFFIPMSQLKFYSGYNPNADWWSKHGIYLPVDVSKDEATRIVNLINNFYEQKRHSKSRRAHSKEKAGKVSARDVEKDD